MTLLKFFICALCMVSPFAATCQDTLRISLSGFSFKSRDSLKIYEIVDARENKNTIGIFHLNTNSQKTPATFASPGLQELDQFLKRPKMVASGAIYLIRVREFALSEGPDEGREWIRLDVRADFFYRLGDYYYYVESSSSRASRSKTSYAELIVQNFFEGFIFFKTFDREPDFTTFFTKEELTNPRVKVP
ncbi:MAG TPA: hypothetical protein VFZ52_00150 [Chryseolinea sp.]